MFIGRLGLCSLIPVGLRLVPEVRAILSFIHAQLLIPTQALWSGPGNSMCQLFIIIFANIFLVFRLVHQPLVQPDSMPITDFQNSWPHKESRTESHTYVLFCHCIYIRFDHCSVLYLGAAVRSFS